MMTTRSFASKTKKLEEAIEKNDRDVVEAILKEKSFIVVLKNRDRLYDEGNQIKFLNKAIINNKAAAMKLLLTNGFNPNPVDGSQLRLITPLWTALVCRREKLAMTLVTFGADVNWLNNGYITIYNHKAAPLHAAVQVTHPRALIELMLREGADINALDSQDRSVLHYAVKYRRRSVPIIRYLLTRGTNVNLGKEPVLLLAIELGNVELVKFLLDNGANVDCETRISLKPIHVAASLAPEVTDLLLKRGGTSVDDLDSTKRTALHWAVIKSNETLIPFLIKEGADIEARDFAERTPLLYAIENGNLFTVCLLLEMGADPNTEIDSRSAIDLACLGRHLDILRVLLKFGAKFIFQPWWHYLSTRIKITLLKHLAQLTLAQKYSNDTIAKNLNNGELKIFLDCQQELQSMKNTYLDENGGISFYRIFTSNDWQLMKLMKNALFFESFENCNVRALFPIYYGIDMEERYAEVKDKFQSFSYAENQLNTIFFKHLPLTVIEKILQYCTVKDLQRIIKPRCMGEKELRNLHFVT